MLNLTFPEVKRFYRAAAAHRDAARSLLDQCSVKIASSRCHEVVYLSGYVVECAFKALLLTLHPRKQHQQLIEWFKIDVKHNLERLRGELTAKGINFPKEHLENLRRVRSQWLTEMRYDVWAWQRLEADRVFLAAERLFEWISGG